MGWFATQLLIRSFAPLWVHIASQCWVLMSAAIKVVHTILRQDFGFEHILWIFSGRRGVHCKRHDKHRATATAREIESEKELSHSGDCDAHLLSLSPAGWICDTRARKLTHDQRSAIVDFLSVYMGKEKKVIMGSTIHPSLQRAYEQLLPYFEDMLESQGWLDTPAQCDKFLEYIDPSVREEFRFSNEDESGVQKWTELQGKVKSWLQKNSKKGAFTTPVISVRTCLIRIVFGHVYPRLDVNVSKHLNHLLKSPFCVHPKTGKVCVPIDPNTADGFDPTTVPHVVQLHNELNEAAATGDLSRSNWQSTSLKPAIEHFKAFVTNLMNANRAENPRSYAKQAASSAQAEVGQWEYAQAATRYDQQEQGGELQTNADVAFVCFACVQMLVIGSRLDAFASRCRSPLIRSRTRTDPSTLFASALVHRRPLHA